MLCLQCDTILAKHQKKFCSVHCSCAFLHKKNSKPPKECLFCKKSTKNPKFCSTKCSSHYNNKLKPVLCKSCDIIIADRWVSRKYCESCRYTNNPNYRDWSKLTCGDVRKDKSTFRFHARIRSLARSVYKRSGKPQHCVNCNYRNHFEVCHIKPISQFDDNTIISTINSISNLVALCPNCHWDLDHGLLDLSKIVNGNI